MHTLHAPPLAARATPTGSSVLPARPVAPTALARRPSTPFRRRVFWLAAAAGYSVDFAAIVMHAVASDDESFGKPCLYCQLDSEEEGEGGLGGSGSGSEEEEAEGEGGQADVLPELRLIPADAAQREWA